MFFDLVTQIDTPLVHELGICLAVFNQLVQMAQLENGPGLNAKVLAQAGGVCFDSDTDLGDIRRLKDVL